MASVPIWDEPGASENDQSVYFILINESIAQLQTHGINLPLINNRQIEARQSSLIVMEKQY